MSLLFLISCYSKNRVIGYKNKLPWHYKDDLQHFKKITMGHPLIIGRKTWEMLPLPLEGRKCIVVTKNQNYKISGGVVAHSIEQALKLAYAQNNTPIICGGQQIYEQTLPLVTTMYLTEIQDEFPGDSYFPEFDESAWVEVEHQVKGGLIFRKLEKREK